MPKVAACALWSLDHYSLGTKLRALRTKKRLTLSRLATETKLSSALLSKLETDRMIPTLTTLATICKVYGVGLSHFFCEPERHILSITRKAHLQGTPRSSEAAKVVPLNHASRKSRLIAQMIDIQPGSLLALNESSGNETCALISVVEGRLQFTSGTVMEVLESGDCAYIESTMALSWSAAGKHLCRILVVRPGPIAAS